MTTKEIIQALRNMGYEVIDTQDKKGWCIIPSNPHCFWDRVDSPEELESYYLKLHKPADVQMVQVDKKTIYHIPTTFIFSLKEMANKLNDLGYNVLVFGAKKGEHHCKVYCKDLSVNLENIVLDNGRKRMTFGKFTHPFEKEWSGYYSAGFTK